MSDEESRKAFEQTMDFVDYSRSPKFPDAYHLDEVQICWETWQAALAWERERTRGLWALAKFGKYALEYWQLWGYALEEAVELGLVVVDSNDEYDRTDLAKLPGES